MASRFRTGLCDLLGCDYPVMQAGMGGVARSELAAAVSEAGGFGCLGMVREPASLIEREVAHVRRRTNKPFAVNLIPAATDAALFDAELSACIDAGVQAMVFFWDVVPSAVERARKAGMKVIYQVGSVEQAVAAQECGSDAIIAQGLEAGGHVHGNVSSLVLLPQVTASVTIPVVASGGFASGASLVAAMALGAQGIHCGTVFLATEESFAHDVHKQHVVEAPSERTVHTDAFVINWPKGASVRVLANEMTDSLGTQLFGHDPNEIGREQIAEEEGRPIYLWSTDSPLRSMTGDLDKLAMFAGQVAGSVDTIPSAGELVRTIMLDAGICMDGLGNGSGNG